jgi:DNA polymerase-1
MAEDVSIVSEETLYLVDGSGYIYRAFYAVAPLSNSKGLPTNALFGFRRMLEKLLKDVSARHIAVAFDRGEPTFRHEKYEAYKANRLECPEDLVAQMPYFRELVDAFGIEVLEQPGVEADDIIGTIASVKTGQQVVIVSGDKDLCQLVSDRVTVWDAMRDIRYDPSGVVDKFGVAPEQIVDYLAIVGDTSDNVPGVSGVGPKTAVALLKHFGSIETMLMRTAEIESIPGLRGAKRVRELIEGGRGQLPLSRELVSLKLDVHPYTDNAKSYEWKGPDRNKLTELFQELEFKEPQLERLAAGNGVKSDRSESYRLATDSTELIAELESCSEFSFDTETDSLDRLTAVPHGISFATRPGSGWYVVLGDCDEELKGKLAGFLSDPAKTKIASNLKFDLSVLKNVGIPVSPPVGDTMLASYILNPDHRQHGLKELSRRLLSEEVSSFEETFGKGGSISDAPIEKLAAYGAKDADLALRVHQALLAKLPEESKKLYHEIELPLVFVLEEIERTGIRVDEDKLSELGAGFQSELLILERELTELAGREINFNSPKQLAELLFNELKLPTNGIKKTSHGFSTDASALEILAKHHPLPAKLLEYREIFKLNSTYIESLKSLINPRTGRVHTSFNQAVAATGRLSSSEPNLQNIPIRNERGRRIREAFVAADGEKLICADYSQIELRILAHLSGDEALCRAFREGRDIHTATAELLFPKEYEAGSESQRKELRRFAKTINFGVIYGMGAQRLSGELGISRSEADRFISNYFSTYSGVADYFKSLEEQAEREGYVQTLYGRRRYIKDINTTGRDPRYAVRSALNAPIQGTAADIMKIAMINLHRELIPGARIVLQVHDELIVECRADLSEEVREQVERVMTRAVDLRVPLAVEGRVSDSWR